MSKLYGGFQRDRLVTTVQCSKMIKAVVLHQYG